MNFPALKCSLCRFSVWGGRDGYLSVGGVGNATAAPLLASDEQLALNLMQRESGLQPRRARNGGSTGGRGCVVGNAGRPFMTPPVPPPLTPLSALPLAMVPTVEPRAHPIIKAEAAPLTTIGDVPHS